MKVVNGNGTFDLGATEVTPTIGMTDFSRRVTDDFGVTTVVERGFSRRMSVKLALPFGTVDAVHRRLSDLRASTALWIADDRFVWLSLFGYYKDFDVDLASPPLMLASMLLAACQDDRPASPPSSYPGGNYVEAAPYPDGAQK